MGFSAHPLSSEGSGMKKELELMAPCGLYCADCNRYRSRSAELARKLLDELNARNFARYARAKQQADKKLLDYDKCAGTLGEIAALDCAGCRKSNGCAGEPCAIMLCARRKSYDGCWQCDETDKCNKFEFLKPFHGDASQQNINRIKKVGLENSIKHRAKFYIWDK